MSDTKQAEQLADRVEQLRVELRDSDLRELAARSGADVDIQENGSVLRLHLMGRALQVTFPDLLVCDRQTGDSLPVAPQALVLYYLSTADGAPIEGRWISFADLPDGRFYNQAFQGYTGKEIARCFGNDLHAFENTARKVGGQEIAYGDSAFAFRALPRVNLAVVYHQGDEDFPASCQILFDASTSHYLPIDVSAILASMLARTIMRAAPA
jgi:hypothetical protein